MIEDRQARKDRAWLLAAALLVATLLSCGEDASDRDGPFGLQAEMEFKRHLELGKEQLRRYLPQSAKAEVEKCERIRSEDPELLLLKARLALFEGKTDKGLAAAARLLQDLLQSRPSDVRALKLLADVERRRGNAEAAAAHRKTIEERYGQLGWFFLEGGDRSELKTASLPSDAVLAEDFRSLARCMEQLNNRGGIYDPSEAVPRLEKLFQKYPETVFLRLWYAELIILGGVRVNFTNTPDLPIMSSKFVIDYAQANLENVLDQVHPFSKDAAEAIRLLSEAALAMADYDEQLMLIDVLLDQFELGEELRARMLGKKGLALFKKGRFSDAITILEDLIQATKGTDQESLSDRWLLHLAYQAAGTDASERTYPFRFRKDLALSGTVTSMSFEDIAPQRRINKLDGCGPSAWADYDRDGDEDLYTTGSDSYGVLYRNDEGLFTDVSRGAALFHVESGFSTTFADYNNDGWPDLYVGRDGWNGPAPNSLYKNNGDGTFTDVTAEAGVGHPGSTFVCAWSDVDRDGDLDLYIANGITGGGDTNVLYRNNGDGTFADVTAAAGLKEPPGTKTVGVAFGDYDLDGWPDIFVSGFATLNRLYHNNQDGTFQERAILAGVDSKEDLTSGYVSFFVDLDNDTYPDIVRTSLALWEDALLAISAQFDSLTPMRRNKMLRHCPRIYHNNRNGTFSDLTVEAGLIYPIGIMGANLADLDNDGFIDFYFGTGDPTLERMEPDRFFRNNGDGTFDDLTFAVGLGNVGKGHGVTFVDIDGDGDLEIYAPEGGFVHGDFWANAFYLNKQTTGNHWLHVYLEGVKSNRDAIDARLVLTAGKLTLMREVKNGAGFGSSNTRAIAFGLGKAAKADRLHIRWPSGLEQTFGEIAADQRIFIKEGEGWRPR